MIILTNSNDVIIAIGDEIIEDVEEQGVVWINGAGYGLDGQKVYEVENIPEHVIPDKYKYVEGEFVLNENYINTNDEKQNLQSIQELETRTSDLEVMLAEILFG